MYLHKDIFILVSLKKAPGIMSRDLMIQQIQHIERMDHTEDLQCGFRDTVVIETALYVNSTERV